jgi:acyl-CoA synthetase (AMP-forming)/AMP-acid ligase II
LILAFETLGIETFSYLKEESDLDQSLLRAADMVIGLKDSLPVNANRVHVITQDWIDDIFLQEPDHDFQSPKLALDSPHRIHHGSGTTGKPKRMIKTLRTHEFRLWQYQKQVSFDRHSRYLVSMPFVFQGIYIYATACIRRGGTVVYDKAKTLSQSFQIYRITHISILPAILAKLLTFLPKDYAKQEPLSIITFGAHVSDRLRARALSDLATNLIETYSTNEAGTICTICTICTIGADGTGLVSPGVEVEVVDEKDQPLIGQAGRIRVRSDGCIASYRDDADATAAMFRDGFFYPGDLGIMSDTQSLKLLGRADDLINVGGVKIDPAIYEEKINRLFFEAWLNSTVQEGPRVKDICVTALVNPEGNEEMWIATVLDPLANPDDMRALVMPQLSDSLGKVGFIQLSEIPRTATGKAQRHKLNALILDAPKAEIAR